MLIDSYKQNTHIPIPPQNDGLRIPSMLFTIGQTTVINMCSTHIFSGSLKEFKRAFPGNSTT